MPLLKAGKNMAVSLINALGDWIDFANVQPGDRIEGNFLIGLDLGRHLLLAGKNKTMSLSNHRSAG